MSVPGSGRASYARADPSESASVKPSGARETVAPAMSRHRPPTCWTGSSMFRSQSLDTSEAPLDDAAVMCQDPDSLQASIALLSTVDLFQCFAFTQGVLSQVD